MRGELFPMSGQSTSFTDLVIRSLSGIEYALSQDNVKSCKTLTQNLLREIILGGQKENQENVNRRIAVERGVVQSAVSMLRHFSISGVERDQTLRLQLVVTCLDLILDLKALVGFNGNDTIPVGCLLRTFGVNVIQKSMVMHWNLRNRSVALLCKSLRVILNVSLCEIGTRMLVNTKAHVLLLDLLSHEGVRDRETQYLIVRILSGMAFHHSSSFSYACNEYRLKTLVRVAGQVSGNDLPFMLQFCKLLCMLSVDVTISQELIKYEALGFVVQALNLSTSACKAFEDSLQTKTAKELNSDRQVSQLKPHAQDPTESMLETTKTSSIEKINEGTFKIKGTEGLESEDELNRSVDRLGDSRSVTTDSLNETVMSVYSAGSQIVSKLVTRSNPQETRGLKSEANLSRGLDKEAASFIDAQNVVFWGSALVNNLCLAMKDDLTMRMVISQAFEASVSSSNVVDSICSDIESTMQLVCSGNAIHVDDEAEENYVSKDEEKMIDKMVERMLASGSDANFSHDDDPEFYSRAVIFNFDYLRDAYLPNLALSDFLKAMIRRFRSLLIYSKCGTRVHVLPLPAECLRIVTLCFLMMSHPLYQRKLAEDDEARNILIGSGCDSLISTLKFFTAPSYYTEVIAAMEHVADLAKSEIRVMPILSYTSLHLRQKNGSNSRSVIGRNSDSDGQYREKVMLSSLSRRSSLDSSYRSRNKPLTLKKVNSQDKLTPSQNLSNERDNGASIGSPSVSTGHAPPPSPRNIQRTRKLADGSLNGGLPHAASYGYIPSSSHLVLSAVSQVASKRVDSLDEADKAIRVSSSDSEDTIEKSGNSEKASVAGQGLNSLSDYDNPCEESTDLAPAENGISEELSLFEWLRVPEQVAIQISLHLEKMYLLIEPVRLVLRAANLGIEGDNMSTEALFLRECQRISFFFEKEIIRANTASCRARVIECVIDIAVYSASAVLRNAALTMASLISLESDSVRRLEISWRNVDRAHWQKFEQLKKVCGVVESDIRKKPDQALEKSHSDATLENTAGSNPLKESSSDSITVSLSANTSPFLSGARIPYLSGTIAALQHEMKSTLSGHLERSDLTADRVSQDSVDAGQNLEIDGGLQELPMKLNDVEAIPLSSSNENSQQQLDLMETLGIFYDILCAWIPTIRRDGDWCHRVYSFEPDPQMQLMLKRLPPVPLKEDILANMKISMRQEPQWAVEQMVEESLYAIDGWIESLFETEIEEEGKVFIAFRNQTRSRVAQNTLSSNEQISDVPSATSSPERNFFQTAATHFFRGATGNKDKNPELARSSRPVSSSQNRDLTKVLIDENSQISPVAIGKLINSLTKRIITTRRSQLLHDSGFRSSRFLSRIFVHVRITVERIIISPIQARLTLGAAQAYIQQDLTFKNRVSVLRSLSHEQLASILGLPRRKDLHLCEWKHSIATLETFGLVPLPTLRVNLLLRLKDIIFESASKIGVDDMNADEFLPVVTFVAAMSKVDNLYSSTMLLRKLFPDDSITGERAYYLTTFEIALRHILDVRIPDATKLSDCGATD